MPNYGYIAYTFRIHRHGRPDEPLSLGDVGGGTDGLVLLYGALRGLEPRLIKVGSRHLRAASVKGVGRFVKFKTEVGNDGVSSNIRDPEADDETVFERVPRHIETNSMRGIIVAPKFSTTGLLILEVQGRSIAKNPLCTSIKRTVRHHTGFIIDFSAVVDQAALEQYLAQAAIRGITLRRSGLPRDVADAVELARNDTNIGNLEMRITPGSVRAFTRSVVDKLRTSNDARRSLLQIGGLDFSDISFTMQVGERQRTLTIDAAQIPSFVYNLPGDGPLPDDAFYKEAIASVEEIAGAVGVTVGAGWQTGTWSVKARRNRLDVAEEIAEGGPEDGDAAQ